MNTYQEFIRIVIVFIILGLSIGVLQFFKKIQA